MGGLRYHIAHRRTLVAALLFVALLVRFAVPAGFMPDMSGRSIRLVLCSGYGPEAMVMPATMPMAAMPGKGGHPDKKGDQNHPEMPCGFSGHAAASMMTVDPILLAVAIAFLFATLFRLGAAQAGPTPPHLRPHLRGPPLLRR